MQRSHRPNLCMMRDQYPPFPLQRTAFLLVLVLDCITHLTCAGGGCDSPRHPPGLFCCLPVRARRKPAPRLKGRLTDGLQLRAGSLSSHGIEPQRQVCSGLRQPLAGWSVSGGEVTSGVGTFWNRRVLGSSTPCLWKMKKRMDCMDMGSRCMCVPVWTYLLF